MSIGVPEDLNEQMGQLISDSSRPSKFDPVTMNLATELAIATFAGDPIQKLRHILEAYISLQKENKRKVTPDDAIHERIIMIYELTLCFMYKSEAPMLPDSFTRRIIIPWKFAKQQAPKYFRVFTNHKFIHHEERENPETFYLYRHGHIIDDSIEPAEEKAEYWKSYYKLLKEGDEETWQIYYQWVYHESRQGASATEANTLQVDFITAVMDEILELGRKIVEMFVSGDTWERSLAIVRGGGKKDASDNSITD